MKGYPIEVQNHPKLKEIYFFENLLNDLKKNLRSDFFFFCFPKRKKLNKSWSLDKSC